MINQTKPTTTYTNSSKVSVGETWATIDTTWATETRTWLAISKLITNITKIAASITNSIKLTATFGKSSIGSSSANTANLVGSKFIAPHDGTITSITFYTKAASGTVNCGAAVYSDVSGQPTVKLTEDMENISVDTNAQWVTVPLNLNISKGTTYWLMHWASGSRTVYWGVGTTAQYYVNGGTFENWANPESGGTFFAREVSIYATYNH